ncbi:hypothetical protein F8M41_000026 [Gigaspora margarita]|uniref:Uncharacterized protein n=1 Tax=Gigaspora margarita TaxID=4874 RepID=A0A8H4EVS1_GIGMA|nr:hypothetical protein F8M41_000026 [Gigaspora margarita]
MLPKYENTMNFQDTNTIYEYDNIINVELASIGKSELFCKVTFKEYNIPIILKSITIPKQFSLKEFIRDLIRHQNIKSHDNVLTIFGLTKQDFWCHDVNKRPSIQYAVEENEIQLDQVDRLITTHKIDTLIITKFTSVIYNSA